MDSDDDRPPDDRRIVIVGVCGAGKTELARRLRAQGYKARSCAQEHSYVPDMWRRLSQPDILIYLDAEAATINRRQRRHDWTDALVDEQRQRLAHARQAADLYIATDRLEAAEVAAQATAFLHSVTK